MSVYRAHPCDCGCIGYVGTPGHYGGLAANCHECHHSWHDHYSEIIQVVDVRPKVFISGPMTGPPDVYVPTFEAAEAVVERAGRKPISPHRAEVNGHSEMTPTEKWQAFMRVDLVDLLKSDEVCVLDGWEDSQGAQLEVHVARKLGIPVAPLWAYRIDAATLPAGEVRATLDL